jgi:hypothetical protein
MELEGQQMAHFLQSLQKSSTPISTGLSAMSGRSVVTAASLTRGPNFFGDQIPKTPHLAQTGVHGQRNQKKIIVTEVIGRGGITEIGDECRQLDPWSRPEPYYSETSL